MTETANRLVSYRPTSDVVNAPELMVGTPSPPHRHVTIANWRRAPFNRWGFQHVRELLPTAEVSRGTGPVWDLPQRPRELLDTTVTVGEKRLPLADIVDDTYTDALIILRGGSIAVEDYRQGMAPDTEHLCMSVTKSVTSTLFAGAVAEGLIDVDAEVTDALPELSQTSYAGATWRNVLDMRTGTARLTEFEYDRDMQITGWERRTDLSLEPNIWWLYTSLSNVKEHGSEYDYRSFLSCLLQWAAERVTGLRHADLYGRLWGRLGAEFPASMTLDGYGNALSDIGLNATARDMARFGEALRLGGVSGIGERIVGPGWTQDTLSPDPDSIEQFVQRGHAYLPVDGAYYRNQWWVVREGRRGGVYYASGTYGQMVMIHEPAEMVVVKFSTWPEFWIDEFAQATIQGFVDLGDQLAEGV